MPDERGGVMSQTFSVILRGEMTPDVIDAIYEIAPDAMLSVDRDELGGLLEFDRDSRELPLETMLQAMDDLEGIAGIRVERLEPDELVYAAEIAERAGRSRQSVDLLIRGERGPGNFPLPVTHADRRNPLWRWSEVEDWFEAYEGRPVDDSHRELMFSVAAINAMLDIRRNRHWLTKERADALLRIARSEPPTARVS
jgi:predicted DNA-binding transcriptional regulator AlpA